MVDTETAEETEQDSNSRSHRTLEHHQSQRCTAHLHDLSFLRGTTSSVLLDRFGEILRSTNGGIGSVSDDGINEYNKSQLVDSGQLDTFLSHSWQANWWHKYLTLLYYFNALPATLAVIISAILWCGLQYACLCNEFWSWRWRGFLPMTLVFLAVLFSWHHIRAFFPRWRRRWIFLDKVCIDQQDAERKTRGIKSIGAILHRSRTLLVAWDRSYFTRLWCTFELAAFLHSQPEGRVICLPIILGRVTSEIALCTWMMELLRVYMDKWARSLAFFFVSLAFASRFHDFLEEVEDLSLSLKDFEARRAQCFCCSNGHCHPGTMEKLPCDRKLVEGSIAHWYGSGDVEEGLAKFDDLIRGQFRKQIREVFRGARMPYHLILVSSVWPAMHQLDYIVEDCTAFHTWAWFTRSLRCAHIMFIGFPLVFATLMATMRCLVKVRILNKCSRTLLFAATNCFLHWVSIQAGRIISRLAESEAGLLRLLRLLFLVFQSLLVFYFFHDSGTEQQTVKIARRLKDVTKDVAYVAHGRATRREQEIELVVPEALASR